MYSFHLPLNKDAYVKYDLMSKKVSYSYSYFIVNEGEMEI